MANHKSAKKRARQNIKRNNCNKAYMSKLKTAIKGFKTAVDAGEKENYRYYFRLNVIDKSGVLAGVTEIFRNYGVNSELRNFWPLIYVNDTLYWVVGLRKSDEAIKNEKKYKSNILVASVEKSSFED